MTNLRSFILRLQKSKRLIKESTEEMNIIVVRPHSLLADDLRKVYKGQEQVNIIVDRRYGERRKESELTAAGLDRRAEERRNQRERNWQMNLIVKKPYAYLIDDLQNIFNDQEDVCIIVDSRHVDNERRKEDKSISEDRRSIDRRKANKTVFEVAISY
jgi:hypothetical protein